MSNDSRLRKLEELNLAEWSPQDRNAYLLFAKGYDHGAQAERQSSVNLLREGLETLNSLPDEMRDEMRRLLKSALTVAGIDYDWDDAIEGNSNVQALNTGDEDAFERWIELGAPVELVDGE